MYNALQYTYSSTQLRHLALVSNHPKCEALGLLTAGGGIQELCRECQRAVLHDITVLSENRVYFTASILKVQWLVHTLHEIVTPVNL